LVLQRKTIAVLVLCALLAPVFPMTEAATTPFPDMQHSWYRYKEAVTYLQGRDVIGGYPDGTFKPKQTINRAELLKIVFKGKSALEPVQRRCFSDVNPDAWFAPYVCSAKTRGIIKGYPDGTFKPDEAVNFAEAIKMILHAYGQDVTEGTGKDWYLPYAQRLEELEILPQHAYVAWSPINRERAADLLWRMLKHDEQRFNPRLSPGCGKSPVIMPPASVMVGGVQRDFLLNVPSSYKAHDPAPLIIAFHGRTNDNKMVRSYMRLDREATDSIIAYPAGIQNDQGTFSWANPGDKAQEIRDIAFFDVLVERLAEDYCIDMDRISVVGHSLGAWMANTVACVRGDVVMASATVGGDSVQTTCAGPAAAMIIHNPKDNLAPFSGAEKVRKLRAETNFCAWETVNTGPTELKCVRHDTCAGGNDILWCPHTIDTDERGVFYPHTWPRGTGGFIADFFTSIQ
jgi:polyhydroxybutyrate depolymerase